MATILQVYYLVYQRDTQMIHHRSRTISSMHRHPPLQAPRKQLLRLSLPRLVSNLHHIQELRQPLSLAMACRRRVKLESALVFL
jgi:hypothetical protein